MAFCDKWEVQMKICVYCSSSSHLDEKYYEAGYEFGKMMAERGNSLVYGGFFQGIMDSVARGVHDNGGDVIAVLPDVFADDGVDPELVTEIVRVGSMSDRKAMMENTADAIAVLPGGIGTMDEFFEVYVLKSLGQYDKPIAVYNVAGFYDNLKGLLAQFKEERFLKEIAYSSVEIFDEAGKMIDYLMEV